MAYPMSTELVITSFHFLKKLDGKANRFPSPSRHAAGYCA